ncbi:MAG: proline--tRNA ligase [Deltaproteobacteria bacterium]|nr:proline--tRNA ligase [Deltaproteobacteria bacterium]MBW2497074.1 proline--tRNA ligase [Deltaproteobacteria bacterium]
MRWSNAFIPTLREDPADAEAISHKLLVRAGYVRQLMAGVYSLTPLAFRSLRKVEGIVREEMERIGAQEFRLPCLHPKEIWERSGRWDAVGEEMFRLEDRRGAELALGMTHEEIFAHHATELRSYKSLPQIWYQFQSKFRDEARPKSGVLRVREFTMKDSYSFDLDQAGVDDAFDRHFEAYHRIFKRLGFDVIAVEASSGVMGGNQSIEFMLESDAGEDWVAYCGKCGYAANLEKAQSVVSDAEDAPGPDAPERFPTPGVKTIEDLAKMEGGAAAERQIKTLVHVVDGKIVLILLRGDHQLAEQKLLDQVEAGEIRPGQPEEIRAALGASPGSLGAVGVGDLYVIADETLRGRRDLVTGANEDGFHLRGVDVERDIDVKAWLDLREVGDGEGCPMCREPLSVRKTIEVGHIFKLGTKYSEAMGAYVQDEKGDSVPIVMGSYGIGLERNLAAVVEANHDGDGICWPVNVAPYEVVITVVKPADVDCHEAGERFYEALGAAGLDVMLDDRDERPGVKFKDADLVGFPYRVTIGPKGLAGGVVELVRRRDGQKRDLPMEHAIETIVEAVLDERA